MQQFFTQPTAVSPSCSSTVLSTTYVAEETVEEYAGLQPKEVDRKSL